MKYRDVTVKYLEDCGFQQLEPIQETTIEDIAYGMSTGMYEVKCEIDDTVYRGHGYTKSGLNGYGSTYCKQYKHEILYYRLRQSYIKLHKLEKCLNT